MNENQIIIFGDICPDNDYRILFDNKENGAFSDDIVADIISAKLSIANLECPATENRNFISKCGPCLKAETEDINILKKIGFNVLSLANNHILDYETKGVLETLNLCKEAGIFSVGAGKDSRQAKLPVIYQMKNKKVGVISFAEAEFNLADEKSPGANHFDPYESYDDIADLRKDCDYLIVLYHGGIEHYKYPSPLLQKKCRKMVDLGADLVLCQHSHCIGTLEKRGNGTILYGQGNSVFGYRKGNEKWNEGFAIKIDLQKPEELRFELMNATPHGIVYAGLDKTEQRIHQMMNDSEKVYDEEWIKKSWLEFSKRQEALYFPMLYGKNRVFNKINRILGNRLIQSLFSRKKQMITMNLLRCEAHHEVLQTIFENNVFSR